MVATVEKAAMTVNTRQVNCVACLTRNCAMNGNAQSPVQVCNLYRQANCAFCANRDCVLNGDINSPVMACDQFAFLAN